MRASYWSARTCKVFTSLVREHMNQIRLGCCPSADKAQRRQASTKNSQGGRLRRGHNHLVRTSASIERQGCGIKVDGLSRSPDTGVVSIEVPLDGRRRVLCKDDPVLLVWCAERR